MPIDIFDANEISSPSDEHVLLNALGGKLVCRGLIDKRTNDKFGRTIDAALAESMQSIRVMLNALSGDGRPPPQVRGTAEDGTQFNVLPGGIRLEPTKPDLRVWREDGVAHVGGSVRSMEELRRLLERTCREEGVSIEKAKIEAVPIKTVAPRLTFGLSFPEGAYRAIAKMACNLFARKHAEEFLGGAFDPIRQFVAGGDGLVKDFVQFNVHPVDMSGGPLGDLDHLVQVSADEGSVTALVCLFAHIQFVVRLGSREGRKPSRTSYRVDQMGRQDRVDEATDLILTVPEFDEIARLPDEAVLDGYVAAMNRLLPIVMDKQNQLYRRSLNAEAVKELARPNSTVNAQEVVDLVVRRYMDQVAAQRADES